MSREDAYYVVYDANKRPQHLLQWPGNGFDIRIWVRHRANWAPAWDTAIDDDIGPFRDPSSADWVSAECAEALKSEVRDVDDATLGRWAAGRHNDA